MTISWSDSTPDKDGEQRTQKDVGGVVETASNDHLGLTFMIEAAPWNQVGQGKSQINRKCC